jgi:CHAT domain-containing protein
VNVVKKPLSTLSLCVPLVLGWLSLSLPGALAASVLPPSLVGESCELQLREDSVAVAGIPPDRVLICGGQSIGSVTSGRLPARLVSGSEQEMMGWFMASPLADGLLRTMRCEEGRPLASLDAPSVMALACRRNNGGWRNLVLVYAEERVVTVAEGPPAALAPMLAALDEEVNWAEVPASRLQSALADLFGAEVSLASSADLERFRDLVGDARTANARGEFSTAESLFREALDLQTRFLSPNDVAVADTLMDLALNVSNAGREEEAEALFRRAEPIIQTSPRASDRARFATYQGYHAANFGRFEEAFGFAGMAVAAWRQQLEAPVFSLESIIGTADGSDPLAFDRGELALALNLQASMALRLEDLGLAEAAAAEALRILTETAEIPRWWRGDVLLTLGELNSRRGRISAAERFFESALQIRQRVWGEGTQTVPVRLALARAYEREGLITTALITYREAFAVVAGLPLEARRVLRTEDFIPYARALIRFSERLENPNDVHGLYAEAFAAFQLLRPPMVEETLSRAIFRLGVEDAELAALLGALQDAERQRDRSAVELTFEQALPAEQRSQVVEDRLRSSRDAARAEVGRLEARLARDFPDYAGLWQPPSIVEVDLRRHIGTREGILTFILGENESYVQLIRREGILLARVNAGVARIAEEVTALRRPLEADGGAIGEFDLARAHELYRLLLGGIETHFEGLGFLTIVPSGPLASLPMSLLVVEPAAAGDYAGAAWLGQRFAISHAPSLNSFFLLRRFGPARAPQQMLLAFGDPALTGRAPGGAPTRDGLSALATSCREEGPAPPGLLRSLAPLPDTAREIEVVRRVLAQGSGGTQAFLGRAATEETLRAQALDDYRVLYFATHALLPGELRCQAEPGLVLSPVDAALTRAQDGLLEASEIAGLRLNADLVVLSACNTAGSAGRFGGDALSGLAEAFFHAGARAMIASHWQVPSAATADLMAAMFEFLGPELANGTARSLQRAQATLLERPETAHPFFWGAFVLVGDGRAESALPIPRQRR